jgi:hypothetical protein
MDKSVYRDMLFLVNSKEQYELLQSYAKARIKYYHVMLETTKETDRIRQVQGAIAELRRFSTLREEVIKGSK